MGDILATAHVSPDATLGGVAFTTHSNTACQDTNVGGGTVQSYRQSGYPSVPNSGVSQVKFDVSYIGTALTTFTVDVSLNGGGAWTNILSISAFGPPPLNVTYDLPAGQSTSQVQIRARHQNNDGIVGSDAGISNIRISVPNTGATGASGGMM